MAQEDDLDSWIHQTLRHQTPRWVSKEESQAAFRPVLGIPMEHVGQHTSYIQVRQECQLHLHWELCIYQSELLKFYLQELPQRCVPKAPLKGSVRYHAARALVPKRKRHNNLQLGRDHVRRQRADYRRILHPLKVVEQAGRRRHYTVESRGHRSLLTWTVYCLDHYIYLRCSANKWAKAISPQAPPL